MMHSAARLWRISVQASVFACVLFLAACNDRDINAPIVPEQAPLAGASQLTCTITTEGVARMECRPSVGQVFARPGKSLVPSGANASLLAVLPPDGIILGGQGTNVLLVSTGIVATPTQVTGNVTVKNLIGQPLGTTDGTTLSTAGVRVFFSSGPTTTSGGSVTVANADGMENFTASDQPYHQYNEILSTDETSAPKQWVFNLSGGATTFTFGVYVWAQVEHPDGWVDVAPPAFAIAAGSTQQLTATVRDNRGVEQVGATVNWSSDNESAATVNSTGLVTGVAAGTANITATSPNLPNPARVGVAVATVGAVPVATADDYSVARNATLTVVAADGLLDNDTGSPAPAVASFGGGSLGGTVVTNAAGATVTPLPQGSGSLSVAADGSFAFTPPTGFTGAYTFDYRISNTHGTSDALVTIDVIGAIDETYPETVVGNVSVNSANVTVPFSVTANDAIAAGATITFAGWNVTPNVTENGGQIVMQTSGPARGQFTYNPPAGFTGDDHFIYTVNSGGATSTATVTLTVANMIWFVQDGATACTTVAAGCGRLSNPFSSLAAFAAVNSGAAPNPQDNHNIFLYGGTTHTGPVTLRNGQRLIGQASVSTLAANIGIILPSGSTPLPTMGVPTTVNGTAVSTVTLGSGNTLRGFMLGNATAAALTGTNFGTLTVNGDFSINNATGQAMSLNTGEIAGNFGGMSSTGGTNNVTLTGVTGSTNFGSGTLTGASGAALGVSGGSISIAYPGNITNAGGALVIVTNGHTGMLTLNGQISTTTGAGLQFYNADGTYDLNGVAAGSTLNGGDAAIDITLGSSGGFTFGPNLTITHTQVGTPAFLASATSGNVIYRGNISKSSTGNLVEVVGQTAGTITFETGTLSATAGSGILASDADGAINFNGTTTLNGGDAHIAVSGGSTGAISFANTSSVTNPSTTAALAVLNGGSATNVTYNGTIATNAVRPVNIEGVSSGTVAVGGNINTTAGLGMLIQNNSGGTITFGGSTKSLSTGTNAAVTLTNNTGASINFANGGLGITTSTGLGFRASGGGTVSVSGANNNISINGAQSGLWLTSMTVGTDDILFNNITSTGTATGSPVCLQTLTGSATQTVTLTTVGIAGTSGGPGVCIGGSAPVTIGTVTIDNTAGAGIEVSSNTGAVAVNAGTIGGTNDPTGNVVDVDGGNANVTIAANLTKNTAGRIVEVSAHTGGTVTLSGSLNCTAACTGINVASNTGGSIDFTNAAKTLNTGANTAVTLATNTGATINFTGGNLDIDVTSATGFNATGGGTVNVTGTNNTVATTGGIGVNIQNTNIGASNVTFQSINKSASSNYGIRVENTGTAGGLKVTGTGAANSGGILDQNNVTASDSAAITLTNTANVDLDLMRINITTGNGASGIVALNLQGTNEISRSTVDYNSTAPAAVPLKGAYGARFVQTSGTGATITLDAVTMEDKLDGTTAGSLSAGGTGTVNFNVIDSNTADGFGSTLQGVFGTGWIISSGDTGGSTVTVNATVSDTRFQNAPANGLTTLGLGANAASTLNYKIKNNVFSAVANASFSAGILNIQSFDTAILGSNIAMDSIVGNTITNSGTSNAILDAGYRGIQVAMQSTAATTHRMVIAGNTITDLYRQGIYISTRLAAIGHYKIINNVVGTMALPVAQRGQHGLETDLQDNSIMNLELTGNTFTGVSTLDTRASLGLRVGNTSGSATLNATVVSNTMQSTVAGNNGRFSATVFAVGTGTMCLDVRTNTLDGATRLYTVNQTGGTFRVEGAGGGAVSSAAITAANTVGTGNVSGTVLFNNGANCTQPPI